MEEPPYEFVSPSLVVERRLQQLARVVLEGGAQGGLIEMIGDEEERRRARRHRRFDFLDKLLIDAPVQHGAYGRAAGRTHSQTGQREDDGEHQTEERAPADAGLNISADLVVHIQFAVGALADDCSVKDAQTAVMLQIAECFAHGGRIFGSSKCNDDEMVHEHSPVLLALARRRLTFEFASCPAIVKVKATL